MDDVEIQYSIKVKDWYVSKFEVKSDGLNSLDIKVNVTAKLRQAWRYTMIEDAEAIAKIVQGKVVRYRLEDY